MQGFVIGKVPFALSPRFKPMLQVCTDRLGGWMCTAWLDTVQPRKTAIAHLPAGTHAWQRWRARGNAAALPAATLLGA